jgi:diacylglycerol O-acyltransferase
MCGSALGSTCRSLDALPERSLVAMVPVSMRRDDTATGNQGGDAAASLGTHLTLTGTAPGGIGARAGIQGSVRQDDPGQILPTPGCRGALEPRLTNSGLAPHSRLTTSPSPTCRGREAALLERRAPDGTYPVPSSPTVGAQHHVNSYVDKMEFGITACRRAAAHPAPDHLEQGLRS